MDIRLPKLGEGADSGTVVNVAVKPGDTVQKDQPLIELENEKAVASIPSTAAGTVTKIHVKVGDKISVGHLLLSLDAPPALAPLPPERSSGGRAASGSIEPLARRVGPEGPPERRAVPPVEDLPDDGEPDQEPTEGALPPAASPTIRKMARELGIDLRVVRGTGRGGRIEPDDLRNYVRRLKARASGAASGPTGRRPGGPAESIDFSKWGPVTKQPFSTLRQTAAQRMTTSWTTIPHVTQFEEADITDLLAVKKKHDAAYEKQGAKLTLTAFLLKILAGALKRHPKFNSSLDEAASVLVLKQYVHIGVAVDTEAGLMVPVIRDVDKKPLAQVAKELNDLAEKTRRRKVSVEDMRGSTFTISNQGGIGGGAFTPIINKPDVAILGVAKGVMKPLVRGGKIEPRTVLPLGLSYDHRVIDGADAARFIVDLVQAIEQFPEAEIKL